LVREQCDIVEFTGSEPIKGMYKMAVKPASCAVQDASNKHAAQRLAEGRREANAFGISERNEARYGVSGGIREYDRSRGGRRGYEDSRPSRSSRYNPDRYYGGNSETKEDKPPVPAAAQAGGKPKKSKKSRRSVVDYGSMMLYGGKSRKSKKSKKSKK